MKKLTLVLLVLVLAASMVFASGSSEAGDKPVKLTVWSGYPETEVLYKKAAEDFKAKHPNVEVEVVTYSLREFEQKLNAAIPAHACADVFDMGISIMANFIDAGLISPNPANIESFLKQSGRYGNLALDVTSRNGKTYGLPFFSGKKALYYNVDMLKEAGYDAPPTTLAEAYEMAKKMTKYDANGNVTVSGFSLRVAGQGSGIAEKFWFILWPMGGDIITEGKTPGTYHAGYNNEGGYKALKYFIDALYVDKIHDHQNKQDAEAFELGFSAMFEREAYVIAEAKSRNPNLNFATAPLPGDVRRGTLDLVENIYVSDDCKNKDLAWEFVLEVLSDANQNYLLENVGWIPVRQDVDYSPVTSKIPEFSGFVYNAPDYESYTSPSIVCFDEIETKLAERLFLAYQDASLAGNDVAIKKVMDDAAEETNAILKRNGLYGE